MISRILEHTFHSPSQCFQLCMQCCLSPSQIPYPHKLNFPRLSINTDPHPLNWVVEVTNHPSYKYYLSLRLVVPHRLFLRRWRYHLICTEPGLKLLDLKIPIYSPKKLYHSEFSIYTWFSEDKDPCLILVSQCCSFSKMTKHYVYKIVWLFKII